MGGVPLKPLTNTYAYAWTHFCICVKGVKANGALQGPPAPTQKNSSRQKRVFLRFDSIDKNGGFSLYTLYKIPMHMHAAMGRYAYGVI